MLDLLRGFSKGWTAKILIGLLVASFAVWGISGSIFYGPASNVVQVGQTNITAIEYRFAYENQLNSLSQQIGRRLTREEADAFGLRNSVLAQVTSGAVLDENSRVMGLGLSDDRLAQNIANDPTFRDLSGTFSRATLQATLRQYGISEDEYIENVKRVAMRNQITASTSDSLDTPEVFQNALAKFQNEERKFDFVAIGEEVLTETPKASEEDLKAFYDENKSRYIAPEYRKLTILTLQASDLSKPQEIPEEEVKAAYDARKDNLRSPEQRRVEQLVLADMTEAQAIKQKLDSGTSFDAILEEQGKTVADIDLGKLTKGELPDTNVAEVAFNAELNKPTDIIEGLFGPVILRVSEIDEEKTTPYDDIKDEIRIELALQKAGDEVFNMFDAVEDERAAGSNLVDTAKALQMKTRTITRIDASGRDENGNAISDIPVLQQLLSNAFDTQPGDDTREIAIGNDGFLWYEVDEIIDSRQKTFEEVKSDVQSDWLEAEKLSRIEAIAQSISDRLSKGEDFNAILAESLPTDSLGNPVRFETTDSLKRSDNDNRIGQDAIAEGFNMSEGKSIVAPANGTNLIVIRVAEINVPDDATVNQEIIDQVNTTASEDIINQVIQDLQSRMDVSINPAAMNAAFNPAGGGGHNGF